MKINYLLLSIVLLSFAACEFDGNEVYHVEVTPPDDKEIILNLADFPSGATIYIYKRTRLQYQLTLPEGEVLKKKFYLASNELLLYDNYIELAPIGNGQYESKLIVDIEIDPLSKSIAGKMGLENYTGKYEYTIVFIPNAVLHLNNISHHKNKDNYFELVWDKPTLEQYTLDKYKITYYHNVTTYVKEITELDQTSFIDSLAVFGTLHYTIETFFKEPFRDRWVDTYTTEIAFPKNSLQFEYTGVNSGRISWPHNEYPSKYALAIGYFGEIVYEGLDNFIEIDDIVEFTRNRLNVFPFSQGGWYELYVMPLNEKEISRLCPIHYDVLYSTYLISQPGGDWGYYYTVFADASVGKLFVKKEKDFWVYDCDNLTLLDHTTVASINDPWHSRVFCSEKTSKIVLTYNDKIEIIDYDFKNHEIIQFESSEKLYYHGASLGTNDVVFIKPEPELSDGTPSVEPEPEAKLYAFDLNSRELINYQVLPSPWSNISVSRDGKYVAVMSDYELTSQVSVYQYSKDGFSLVYHEFFKDYGPANATHNIYFNAKESNLMIIVIDQGSASNETYVVNLNDGTKTLRRLVSYVSSDPFNGNILTNYGVECKIYDQTFTKEIFVQERTIVGCILNNVFFTNASGGSVNLYYLDITN